MTEASTTTRRLLLMRHAKAAWPDGVADHERPLASRGRRDAPQVGEWLLAQALLPDLVLSSDATRTRETTSLVLQGAGRQGQQVAVVHTGDLYESSVHRVLHVVAGVPDEVRTLLVVGHEPTTSETVRVLTGRSVPYPTATVAAVEVDGSWSSLQAGAGRLLTVRSPREG